MMLNMGQGSSLCKPPNPKTHWPHPVSKPTPLEFHSINFFLHHTKNHAIHVYWRSGTEYKLKNELIFLNRSNDTKNSRQLLDSLWRLGQACAGSSLPQSPYACKTFSATLSVSRQIRGLQSYVQVSAVYLAQHKACTRKTGKRGECLYCVYTSVTIVLYCRDA